MYSQQRPRSVYNASLDIFTSSGRRKLAETMQSSSLKFTSTQTLYNCFRSTMSLLNSLNKLQVLNTAVNSSSFSQMLLNIFSRASIVASIVASLHAIKRKRTLWRKFRKQNPKISSQRKGKE